MRIVVNVDVMLAKNKMSLNELSEKIGIHVTNLSLLKTGKTLLIKFSTMAKLCNILKCQPGDLFEYRED